MKKVLTYTYVYCIIIIRKEVDSMFKKIKKALLNTRLAAKLIDKYLAKQSIIDIANSFKFD